MNLKIPASANDSEDLSKFGYGQQLKRSIHGFSSYALSFSLISMTTGIFANFGQGIRQFGPAVVWSWLLVAAGQFLVALVLAELSTYYPLTGYGYQWTSRLVNPHYGFFVGWILLLQFLTGFSGVCAALGTYLRGYPGLPQLKQMPAPWITVGIMTLIALIHIFGIKLAALVNDAGVIAELIGSILVALVLISLYGARHPNLFALLRNTSNAYTGRPAGIGGFALSLLMGAWCLTGFEAAADMAEETYRPGVVVPRAIILSEVTAGLGGFIVLIGFIVAMPSLRAAQASDTPLSDILQARLGGMATNITMAVVFISIFACGLASMAATTRVIFSMSRDNMLPGASLWKRVGAGSGTPVTAIVLVWAISCAVVIGFAKLELITSISAVAGFLGYAGILFAATRGMRGKKNSAGFSLGKCGRPLSILALVWSLLLTAALAIPESQPGAGHTPAIATLLGVSIGAVVYFGLIRTRLMSGTAGPPLVAQL